MAELRFDGLYVQGTPRAQYRQFVRFYENGAVVSTMSTGQAYQVMQWLKEGVKEGFGEYTLKGGKVKFTIHYSNLKPVDHVGVLQESGELEMTWHSHINGFRGEATFKFLTWEEASVIPVLPPKRKKAKARAKAKPKPKAARRSKAK